jgi:hypothetical protein
MLKLIHIWDMVYAIMLKIIHKRDINPKLWWWSSSNPCIQNLNKAHIYSSLWVSYVTQYSSRIRIIDLSTEKPKKPNKSIDKFRKKLTSWKMENIKHNGSHLPYEKCVELPYFVLHVYLPYTKRYVLFAYFHPMQILIVKNYQNKKKLQSPMECGCSR